MPKGKKRNAQNSKKSAPSSRAAPRRNRPSGSRVAQPGGPVTSSGLSKCSDDYLKSLQNPWGPTSPCLPSGFPLPSLKRKFFARGTFGQGVTTGYIAMNPRRAVTADLGAIAFSDGNYTGNTVTTVGTGVHLVSTNSAYVAANFSAIALKYRVVSAGIRVRYDGTELNRGGRIIPIESPNHQDLMGFNSVDILAMQGVQPVRPSSDGKWITVVWSGPKDSDELDYDSSPSAGTFPLVIMIEGGVAPTGVSPSATANFVCEWECWANYEIIGVALSGQTISHHDPVGASLAANAVATAQQAQPHAGSPSFASHAESLVKKYAGEAVTDTASLLWKHRGTIATVAKDLMAFV